MLELADGRQIGQSSAISEYLGKKFNLIGNDEWDEARCTEISGKLKFFAFEV